MTVTTNETAGAINRLLRFLMPSLNSDWHEAVTEADAVSAAAHLADAANKKLYAGVNGADVRAAWKKNRPTHLTKVGKGKRA